MTWARDKRRRSTYRMTSICNWIPIKESKKETLQSTITLWWLYYDIILNQWDLLRNTYANESRLCFLTSAASLVKSVGTITKSSWSGLDPDPPEPCLLIATLVVSVLWLGFPFFESVGCFRLLVVSLFWTFTAFLILFSATKWKLRCLNNFDTQYKRYHSFMNGF